MSSSRPSNRPRRGSATQQAGRTSSPAQAVLDFNALWKSRDLTRLGEIPMNERGLCGCRICGQPTVIKGSLFKQHMIDIHAPIPTTFKRPRPTSLPVPPRPSPSSPLVNFSPLESPALIDLSSPGPAPPQALTPTLGLQLSLMDMDIDDGNEGDTEGLAGGGYDDDEVMAHDGGAEEDRPADAGLPQASDSEEDNEAAGLAELARLLERTHQSPPLPSTLRQHSVSPPASPHPRTFSPVDLAAVIRGTDAAHQTAEDLIIRWPHPLPSYLLPPYASGSKPNPFAGVESTETRKSVFETTLPLLAHTLVGFHNVSRRAVELALRVSATLVWHARLDMYERFKRFYGIEHPDADAAELARLEEGLAPSLADDASGSRTVKSALAKLDIDDTLVVHPVCKNHDCNHVFYSIVEQNAFHQLPVLCPSCSYPTKGAKGSLEVLHFPRRTLQVELEVVLRVPGVEEAIERSRDRKAARDERDAQHLQGMRVYRQQDDGSAWEQRPNRNPALDDALKVTVNLGVDWANPNHHRSAATSSMGPISLQIADLPTQLRSSFSCCLLMGITPAPKQPSGKNLYKFLLPLILELRDAEINGVWVRTPSHPLGRLVKVRLGCICTDRPAACEVTGGPYFGNHASPCLRCTISHDEIASLAKFPARSSYDHDRGIIEQLTTIPIALQADREAYDNEPARDPLTGKKKQGWYTNVRREQALERATLYRGHLSAVGLIPGFDKFPSTVFDPMHTLLEGCCNTYFHRVMQAGAHTMAEAVDVATGDSTEAGSATDDGNILGTAADILVELQAGAVQPRPPAVIKALKKKLGDMEKAEKKAKKAKRQPKPKRVRMSAEDILELQQLLPLVTAPSTVQRLHPLFGTASAGTPSASDWRVFATVYAPLVLPLLFARRGSVSPALSAEELDAMLSLSEIVHLALRSSISEAQVCLLEAKILSWQEKAFRLHPGLIASTNLHVISHLGDDIRSFGPSYGWWSFLVERINHVIKSTNRSGGSHHQAQVVALRAAVRSRDVVSARARALKVDTSSGGSYGAEHELASELDTLFDPSSSDAATSILEQISSTYSEMDRQLLHGSASFSQAIVSATRRGRSRSTNLGPHQLNKLQSCLAAYGQATSLSARGEHPYLSPRITEWEGLLFGGRRLDAAEWNDPLGPVVDGMGADTLVCCRNSLFEARRSDLRFKGEDTQVRSGVISRIFEHQMSREDGTSVTSLYAVIRRFKPYTGSDVYGFRRYPSMDIWTWEGSVLEESSVIALKSNTLDALRPLALISLPADPTDEENSLSLWATIPVHHH